MDSSSELATVLAKIDDPETMAGFLEEILTPGEKKDITLRWRLLLDLYAGKTQREIAAQYGISLCKITRGSKILKKSASVTRGLLKRYGETGENTS